MRAAGRVAALSAGSLLRGRPVGVTVPLAGARSERPVESDVVGLRVYAVDDESVQLTWRASPAGRLAFGTGTLHRTTDAPPPATVERRGRKSWALSRLPGGPGSTVLEGLRPDTDYEIWAETPGRERRMVATARTLPRPPGRLLCRLATLNDIHIGERQFGLITHFEDRHPFAPGVEPYPLRCARAAVLEAVAWGAQHLIVKGDLTRDSEPAEFRAVGRLLAEGGVPADVVLGNHDVRHGIDATTFLSEWGIDARKEVRMRDLPGLRVILAHTPGPGDRWGQILPEDADRIARLARSAPGPCMVVAHHPPATGPVTLHYPPGIYRAQSQQFLRRLATANPASVVVAGHTHRNRLHSSHGLPCVETASTKDHPGQWTGYRVFEGGIVQTARRIAAPAAMAWTEANGLALHGQWGRWAPGTLSDRSWSLTWPAR